MKSKIIALILVVIAIVVIATFFVFNKPKDNSVIPSNDVGYTESNESNESNESKEGLSITNSDVKFTTVADIKAEFKGDSESKYKFKPFYNVEQTTEFTFRFNSNVDPVKAVTVHTDSKCEEASTVYQINDGYKTANGVDVVVKPNKPILGSKNRSDYKGENCWGYAPIYYLCVRYDLDSSTIKKLDDPIIIPFTIKNSISTPTAYANISDKGVFSVDWLPVENAVNYRIYSVSAPFKSDVRKFSREEVAYSADESKLKLLKTVDSNTFSYVNDSVYPNNATVYNAKNTYSIDKDFISSQNYSSGFTYYVTAVDKDGNESFFSKAIPDWNLLDVLPYRVDPKAFIGSITDFKDVVDVVMLDQKTIMKYPINFHRIGEVKDYSTSVAYSYEVIGTELGGIIQYKNEDKNFPEEHLSAMQNNVGGFYRDHLPEIAPVSVPPIVDSQYANSSINLKDKTTYPEEAKIKLDDAALLRRADIESARNINDGIYPRSLDEITSYVASDNPEYIVIRKNGVIQMVKRDDYKEENASTTNNAPEEKPVENEQQDSPLPENNQNSSPNEGTPKPSEVETHTDPTKETTPISPEVEVVEVEDQPSEEINNNNYVEVQKESTKRDVEEGNKEKVPTTDFPIVAQTAGQKYLALALINHDQEISLKAFPEYQNQEELVDDLFYVWYQNPYIMTVILKDTTIDPAAQVLFPKYGVNEETTKRYQSAVLSKSKEVANSIITPEMNDYEKSLAIYEYLEKNGNYNHDALNYAMAGNEDLYERYPNSWNTYGILCENLGVCQSYAYAYNAIAQQAGLDSILLSGYIGNTGHAWNAVKLDGKWYTVDATNNNKSGSFIPYWILNTSYEFAKESTFVLDDRFVDGELTTANNPLNSTTTDNSQDWYTKNNLYANSIQELAKIVKNNYNGQKIIFVKCGPGVVLTNQTEYDNFGRELLNEGFDTNYLKSLRFLEVKYGVWAFGPEGSST